MPYSDEWFFVDTLRSIDNGSNWFNAIYAQHNEHRLLVPRIIFLGFAKAAAWNVKAEMVAGWAISCLSFLILWSMLRDARIYGKGILILISCLFFNLGQWENILWGWQVSLYLMIFSVLCAVFFLSRDKVVPASVAAAVASFSFANGLLIWPLGLTAILFSTADRPKKTARIIYWLLAGVVIFTLYLHDYVRPVHNDLMTFTPFQLAFFFFANIGSMLGGRTIYLSILIGLFLFSTFAVFTYIHHKNKTLRPLMPWLITGLFSLASAMAISVVRAGFGIKQAMPPKYTSISALLIIAVIVMALSALRDNLIKQGNIRRYFIAASLAILVFGAASFYVYGIVWGYKEHASRALARQNLISYAATPDSVLQSSDIPATVTPVRELATYLEKKRLSVFNVDN